MNPTEAKRRIRGPYMTRETHNAHCYRYEMRV